MKIMITGAAGFLGSHLSEKYVNEDHIVYGIDNLLNGNLNNVRTLLHRKNFKFIHDDIRNRDLYSKIPNDLDAVIHLAAQIHVDRSIVNPEETFDINVSGTMKILEYARMNDINKILFASTSEVYGSAKYVPMDEDHPLAAQHPYGVSKIAADRLCYTYNETYDLGIDIIRCFNFYGPRQKDSGYGGVIAIFINRVLQNKPPIIYGDGNQTRDYMYVDDAVNAYDKVLKSNDNPGKYGINFGTGTEKSVNEIAELILKYSGNEKKLSTIHVDARPTEVQRLFADISKAQKSLDFVPKIEFEQGISLLMDWYRNYKSELWLY
ncbi:GDP-mannose 4,6-dehydratase [Candidatus Nitrosocosmicus arcticus]|uniref:NAD-dependent epimerase/dehydratase family n=1 Tax=Candidatus Nitrosocosmicus arcticus TaxID=2035267 RepID=A0A557SYL2_9ARCH|nr:GDP-mannose 4,6-dehydratase [Candidatus Nitrosocosmicus arcticus]TVP41697.1 NAD-dependent epimerase/dehydratase family [Candidatus Nitrosocosmicus arcticus]